MVLQLPNDVLFDSGRAAVKQEGKATIQEVAAILKTIGDRQFQIAGHTDNEPIRSSSYPSNWYLSTSRAIKVVEILIDEGVDPKVLSACGYGEFDPVAPNDTAENKAKNRRIEIVIQPNVDELLTVDNQGW
jgi:chemotaxis protein MotB